MNRSGVIRNSPRVRRARRGGHLEKEVPADVRDHQMYASHLAPVHWPALLFLPDRKSDRFTRSKLDRYYRVYGLRYYRLCQTMLLLGFLISLTREDPTVPIVVIGLLAYWLNMYPTGYENFMVPNYRELDWSKASNWPKHQSECFVPEYWHHPPGSRHQPPKYWGSLSVEDKKLICARVFYMRHCITAAELFLVSLIFSIVLDVLWIAVHGDYLHDYGDLPLTVDWTIKSIVRIHKFVWIISILQLFLKLASIYFIICYIRILCAIYWLMIPTRVVAAEPPQYHEPLAPPRPLDMPEEPPAAVIEAPVVSPSVADL